MNIRPAELKDSLDILRWRNDTHTRLMSRNQQVVAVDEHSQWYTRLLSNPNRMLLIGELVNQSLGMVRFDRLENSSQWEISITLAPEFRNRGLSKELLEQAISYFRSKFNNGEIIAEIKEGNQASRKLFTRVGFNYISRTDEMLCFSFQ
ncbi:MULTISPECIES: GNAT family N-acetyltransferase [Legionella]|uniref:N-Acyltransferase (NAT) n=1 Tax=Legionella steelei TaxID=947033 RepID=A0A0W0ZKN6_9GAMM|nr:MULTISPECIES: GNAT family N-acetyltransferase [Legionella]KTD69649.1 N-Acyltransferase (NAT) [Legionella steelei]MBN9227199.1 GNAT family N-acetyltransferase [Legionella steelei]OJW07240.1 MAG: hypothetical protein BGO44_16580 [Legionella sp. 39-23]